MNERMNLPCPFFALQYERVVEPLMLDPSAESIAATGLANPDDPRMQIDHAMLMPYQVWTCS